MYDRLGDLLNETLKSGAVKFIRIDSDGTILEDGADSKNDASKEKKAKTETVKNRDARSEQKKSQRIIYKKITPEIERCYRLLDITVSASLEDIKKAYKEKLKYFHPDKHAGNPVLQKIATDKTRQIVEAYKTIVTFIGND